MMYALVSFRYFLMMLSFSDMSREIVQQLNVCVFVALACEIKAFYGHVWWCVSTIQLFPLLHIDSLKGRVYGHQTY